MCSLREGYRSDGTLISEKISSELGFVIRSRKNNSLAIKNGWDFEDSNSSLIVDAYK